MHRSPPVLSVKTAVDSASSDERASKAEAELLKALDDVSSLKLQLGAAESEVAKTLASCEERIKKYDADLVHSGQTAASLRRQLSDAAEEKARAIADAGRASQQEATYKTAIANLQSSMKSAQHRIDSLQCELNDTKQRLSDAIQCSTQSTASSSKRIGELDSALFQANATIQEQAALISALQAESKSREESLAAASANITSWTEHCAGLKRQIDELRISEASLRETARFEVETAAYKVNIAEDMVRQMQTECCAAQKAKAEVEASSAAQAKSHSLASKLADEQARTHGDAVAALRKELEQFKDVHSRFEAESVARIALEKKCAAAEDIASTTSSEQRALIDERESLKGQLERAIQSANASALARDSLKAEVDKLSAQLHGIRRDYSVQVSALQNESDSIRADLAHVLAREKEQAAAIVMLTSQITNLSSANMQEKEDSASLKIAADESAAQIAQLKEHLAALRDHVAQAAHARVVQDEVNAALSAELETLQKENCQLKEGLTESSLEEKTNADLKAQIKRLQDDKKTLQGQVDSLMESAKLALQADRALAATQAQVEPSMEAARRYRGQVDEMRIQLDKSIEATASLSTQVEDLSSENAVLKEQVVILKDQVNYILKTSNDPTP